MVNTPPQAQAGAAAAAANPINVADLVAALQQLQAGGQQQQQPPARNHKVTPFSSADPVEWHSWRRQFLIVVGINGWPAARAIQEAAAAMEGLASRYTADIDHQQFQDLDNFLDQYEAKFCPPAESAFAKMEYSTAEQEKDESVLMWHTRLRSLFIRAYPGVDPNTSEHLKDDFIARLRDVEVQKATLRARPATFAVALTEANNNAATEAIVNRRQLVSVSTASNAKLQIKKEPGINALGRGIPNSNKMEGCFVCGGDHIRKYCEIYKRVLEMLKKEDRLKEHPRKRNQAKKKKADGAPPAGDGRYKGRKKGVNHLGDSSASEEEN